jgi:transcriptional regulator with XRE-family HTH domain
MQTTRPRRTDLALRRLHVGLSQEQLAEHVGVSVTAISNWERGVQEPSPRYRQPLAEALQVDLARLDRMIDPTTPLTVEQHAVDHWLDLYESLIQAAGSVWQVATIAVPGLLQIREYADAAERVIHTPVTDEFVAEQVELRLLRQRVLDRTPEPLTYQVLIEEWALLRVVGDRSIMAAQLDHLDQMFHRPNIDLRIVPTGGALCARSGFELLCKRGQDKPFLAVTIDIDSPRYEQRQVLVRNFAAMYDYLLEAALSPADSLARIRHLQRSHR